MRPDRTLVEAVLAAAPGAFERLMSEYQGLCWHIIHRMVRNPEDARDLCQETFLRVHLNLHQFRYESPLKHWIGRIAFSIALRHLKRHKNPIGAALSQGSAISVPEETEDAFDFEAAYDDLAIARRLHEAIEVLPPIPRMLLTLYHLDDVAIPDIAKITGLPAGTIKSHLYRARLRLRELLEPSTENLQ